MVIRPRQGVFGTTRHHATRRDKPFLGPASRSLDLPNVVAEHEAHGDFRLAAPASFDLTRLCFKRMKAIVLQGTVTI